MATSFSVTASRVPLGAFRLITNCPASVREKNESPNRGNKPRLSTKIPPKLRYGAARAHNRHMADFCAHDPRLMGVAIAPLDEPTLALEELEFALKSGA